MFTQNLDPVTKTENLSRSAKTDSNLLIAPGATGLAVEDRLIKESNAENVVLGVDPSA
jgi:hypothetical protein